MKYLTLFSTAFLLLAASCKKHDSTQDDYFVFGRVYAMCTGPGCAQFYKIQNGHIYADNMEYYTYANAFSFSSTPLPQARYSTSLPARTNFPAYMRSNPGQTWGCPDCHDQGGYHFALSENGTATYWHVDTDTGAQPPALRPYMAQILDILNQLDH